MNIGSIIIYTPEIITISKGDPVEAKIMGESIDGVYLRVQLADGSEERVEKRMCELA